MRQQVEEAEKTLYARRQRQNESQSILVNGSVNEEAQSINHFFIFIII